MAGDRGQLPAYSSRLIRSSASTFSGPRPRAQEPAGWDTTQLTSFTRRRHSSQHESVPLLPGLLKGRGVLPG